MQQIYLNSFFKGYDQYMKYISNIAHMSEKDREVIARRIKIIEFYDQFGQKATAQAFSKSKSTVMLWKQKLKLDGCRLSALKPGSKAPKSPRQKKRVDPKMEDFVFKYRTNHPGVSKATIKPQLDLYCLIESLPIVSESTIGRIINELKVKSLIPTHIKMSFYARNGELREKKSKNPREKKLRVKDYRPENPGDLIQVDAITVFSDGLRRYLVTAIDIRTRFAFAYSYKTLSSFTATDFLKKFKQVAPFSIKRIQTDNGQEFHKYFRDYAKKKGIVHYYNYPRHPKMNAYIERFNGLIQSQYVSWHLKDLFEPKQFNLGLMKYLLWYNTEKPHCNIGKIPPLRYYLDSFIFDTKKSNMLWTVTQY